MVVFRNVRKGLLFTLSASFLGAIDIVFTRYLLTHGENPLNLSAWKLMLTVLPWCVLFQKHAGEFRQLSARMKKMLLFIGVASSLGVNYLLSLALANSPAVNFSFLYRTIIIFTIVFAWIFFKEKITKKKLLLMTFVLFGSYLVTTGGKQLQFTLGDMYTLMMAASAAFVSNILTKHTISKMHPDLSASVTTIVASLSLMGLAIISGSFAQPHNLVLMIIGSGFYFFHIYLRNRAFAHSTASFVTLVFALSPVYVTILSYLFLGERLSVIECVGGLIIVGSVFFVERLKI